MENCKICGSPSEFLFEKLVLDKYPVNYYKCTNCAFAQTENEFWLNEAYSSAITNQDIGLLYRNIYFRNIVSGIIKGLFNKSGKFIDYGGGYGTFVRLMRDNGFNFSLYDTYCENIFAKGHDKISGKYDLLTSFEVFEHLQNPIDEVEKMLTYSDNILFSTEIQPLGVSSIDNWWYVMPETGQHIALHSRKSLQTIADSFNLNFYSNNTSLHILTKNKLNKVMVKALFHPRINFLFNQISANLPSLLNTDYNKLISR